MEYFDITSKYIRLIAKDFSKKTFMEAMRFLLFAINEDNTDIVHKMISEWSALHNIDGARKYKIEEYDKMLYDLGEDFVKWLTETYRQTIDEWYNSPLSDYCSKNKDMTWQDAVLLINEYVTNKARCEVYEGNIAWNLKLAVEDEDSQHNFDDKRALNEALWRAKYDFFHDITRFNPVREFWQDEKKKFHAVILFLDEPLYIFRFCRYFKRYNPLIVSYMTAIYYQSCLNSIAIVLKKGIDELKRIPWHTRVKVHYDTLV